MWRIFAKKHPDKKTTSKLWKYFSILLPNKSFLHSKTENKDLKYKFSHT